MGGEEALEAKEYLELLARAFADSSRTRICIKCNKNITKKKCNRCLLKIGREKMFSLLRKRKELELEIEKLELTLANEKEAQRQEIVALRHEHKLLLLEEKKKHELEALELQTLSKLKTEQEIAKVRMSYESQLKDLEVANQKALSQKETDMAKEYYDKLHKAMLDLNLEGSAQTKFVQDLALTMMGKGQEKSLLPTQHTLVLKDVKTES